MNSLGDFLAAAVVITIAAWSAWSIITTVLP